MGTVPAIAVVAPTPEDLAVPSSPTDLDPLDCEGPAGDPDPGTAEWLARDAQNHACAHQRRTDRAAHPALADEAIAFAREFDTSFAFDPYRVPHRHAGERFRFDETTVTNREGALIELEIYRPCAPGTCIHHPGLLSPFEPPYPVVIVVPGSSGGLPSGPAAPRAYLRWAAQSLAEAGYMTVLPQPPTDHVRDTHDLLAWLAATPDGPTPAGEHNPYVHEADLERVGIAGHSLGGATAHRVGQGDDRIGAVVVWDRSGQLPDILDTPTLAIVADYRCERGLVCLPDPRPDAPDPDGPGNLSEDFRQLRAAGVDVMQLWLRATTHYDWAPGVLAGNRYAELVSLYYTKAWFDRYLKGAGVPHPGRGRSPHVQHRSRGAMTDAKEIATDAYRRLVASAFDASADIHNISQGFFDPVQAATTMDPYGGNVPYTLAGRETAHRLSFYYLSKCYLTVPGSTKRASSEDMRADRCTDA